MVEKVSKRKNNRRPFTQVNVKNLQEKKNAFEFRGMRNLERQKDLKQIQEMEFQENSQDSDREGNRAFRCWGNGL